MQLVVSVGNDSDKLIIYVVCLGAASELFFIQMAITVLCSFVTGQVSNGSVYPMVIMTSIASASFCLVWVAF